MRKDHVFRLSCVKDSNGKFVKRYKGVLTKEGRFHHAIMSRGTNMNVKSLNPNYLDCNVSNQFRDFQLFAEWCNSKLGFKQEGWVVDKNLLVPKKQRLF